MTHIIFHPDRIRSGEWLRRRLAGLLAVAALASATLPLWYGWGLHVICGFTFITGLVLAFRAVGRPKRIAPRWVWVSAVMTFGFWTLVIASNQFHGKPPASSIYLIYGWASVTLISLLGLAVEAPRTAA